MAMNDEERKQAMNDEKRKQAMNDEERKQAMNDEERKQAMNDEERKQAMNDEKRKQAMNDEEREQWLKIRKEAGLHIDPATAEVFWTYAQTLDPYGVYPEVEECVGREYFARAPGSDIWVLFDDIPRQTRDALWSRYSSILAFPSGLEGLDEVP
jgi:hypothetical protein